jgi:hypothetical protein
MMKFDKNGKFIKEWGKLDGACGAGSSRPARWPSIHGRLFIADRDNFRMQIHDQDGSISIAGTSSAARAASSSTPTTTCS